MVHQTIQVLLKPAKGHYCWQTLLDPLLLVMEALYYLALILDFGLVSKDTLPMQVEI